MKRAIHDHCPVCGSKIIEGMSKAYCSECEYWEVMKEVKDERIQE